MPKQVIGIGTSPNDGLGDPIRTAAQKINDNFTELYAAMIGAPLGRNVLINGTFQIWQRGTSFSASGYTADRWYMGTNTNTVAVSPLTPELGSLPSGAARALRWARTAGSADAYLTQPVEGVGTFSGSQACFSFWAKSDSSASLEVYFRQGFGTGGSTAVSTTPVAIETTTGWARYSVVTTIPSIVGKTVGTGSYLEVCLSLKGASGNKVVDIADAQFELGSAPSQLELRPVALEHVLCKRYFQKFGPSTNGTAVILLVGGGYVYTPTAAVFALVLDGEMRANPTSITLTPNATGFGLWTASGGGAGSFTLTALEYVTTQASPRVIRLNATVASGLTIGTSAVLVTVSAAASLFIEAEL